VGLHFQARPFSFWALFNGYDQSYSEADHLTVQYELPNVPERTPFEVDSGSAFFTYALNRA
jgi:hypothetical protein